MLLALLQEREVERQSFLFVGTIDTCNIPCLATAACHHHRLTGIAREQTGLVPDGRQGREELLHVMGLGQITLGTVGQMLQTTLEEHRQCQFMGMCSDMRMLRVAECARGIVHRTNHITGERQCGIVGSRLLGEGRHIIIPLGTIDALGTHQVGIGALPATRDGGTMEINQQMVLGSTLQQVDAIVHILLGIAREEVDLHASHTNLLAPGKLLLTVFGLVQTELRTGSTIYPTHRGVVPDKGLDTL